MNVDRSNVPTSKPLRLWPGAVAAVLVLLIRFVLPVVAPNAEFFGMDAQILAILAGLGGAVLILLWWLFFSRAPWSERLIAIGVMVLAVIAIRPLTHISIQGGMMGRMFYIYAAPPTLTLALVAWAVASRNLTKGPRRVAMVAAILIGCGVWTLARTNGIHGGAADLEWRWTPTAEERFLAQVRDEPTALPPSPPAAVTPTAPLDSAAAKSPAAMEAPSTAPAAGTPAAAADVPATAAAPATIDPAGRAATGTPTGPAMNGRGVGRVEWPGFRGPERKSVIDGVRINTEWSAAPPVEMWRRPIGPGWSSFAVAGDLLYTQEQRGDDEAVAAYNVTTGKPVWIHRDKARFWESNGGVGPRGTPTLSNGRVYTLGATGIVNALDASTGTVVWSHNAQSDTEVQVPGWGFTSSPLVIDGTVIIAVSGALIAYDAATGERRWFMKSRGGSYSSPHLVTIDGVKQVLLMGGRGTTSVAAADGTVLWESAWEGVPMVQPAQLSGGDVLITTADAMGGLGTRRLSIAHGSGGWTVQQRWESRGLKPYFNDFVVHNGHAFGFDGSILACINLEDGERKWKGGRYGNGQLVLLADQDVLLVVSEEGELALVSATTDQFKELARFPALNAKTWNHPVLVGDILLVRNGEEMAAFRLPLDGPSKKDTLEEK